MGGAGGTRGPGPDGEPLREERVGSCWGNLSRMRDDRVAMRRIGWAEHPLVENHINRRVSGDPETYWVDWAAGEFLRTPCPLGLSLGCGSGYIERLILRKGYAEAMEGVDVAAEAVRTASRAAGDLPVSYRRLDLDTEELGSERYDLVISAAALHHVTNLEGCLSRISECLKPGGLLIANEFVGPDRFQWSDRRLEILNRAYESLPARYRFNHLTGEEQVSVQRKPLWHMIEADPSEAVRSSEIPALITEYFRVLDTRVIGGGLMHPLLEGIIGNFREGDPMDDALLEAICSLDAGLTSNGLLPGDFQVIIARKGRPPQSREEAERTGREKMDIISRQEKEILEQQRRLEEADEQNRRLAGLAESRGREIEELRADRERLLEENLALKEKGPLKTLRFLRSKLKRRSRS